jgi:hypothetical protein
MLKKPAGVELETREASFVSKFGRFTLRERRAMKNVTTNPRLQ